MTTAHQRHPPVTPVTSRVPAPGRTTYAMRSRLRCCRADHCHAEIIFVALSERPGRTACLDAAPVDPVDALHRTRLVQVSHTAAGSTAQVLSGAHLARAITVGETLFDFHSKTCTSSRHQRPIPDRVGAARR